MSPTTCFRAIRLQAVICLTLFSVGLSLAILLSSLGVSPKKINRTSLKLTTVAEPLRHTVKERITGGINWMYFVLNNGFANLVFMSLFFATGIFKSFHTLAGEPGFFSSMLYRFTAWHLRLLKLSQNNTSDFLNLAMLLTFPSFVGLGFLSFLFGVFTVSAIKMAGLKVYLLLIVPHGVFEIPSVVAAAALPVWALLEIIRRKSENERVDTFTVSRELVFSRPTAAIICTVFLLTIIAAIIEDQCTPKIIQYFCPGK